MALPARGPCVWTRAAASCGCALCLLPPCLAALLHSFSHLRSAACLLPPPLPPIMIRYHCPPFGPPQALISSGLSTAVGTRPPPSSITADRTQIRWRLSDDPIFESTKPEHRDPAVRAATRCRIFLAYTSNLGSAGTREHIRCGLAWPVPIRSGPAGGQGT
jgi:hypothetical protein